MAELSSSQGAVGNEPLCAQVDDRGDALVVAVVADQFDAGALGRRRE